MSSTLTKALVLGLSVSLAGCSKRSKPDTHQAPPAKLLPNEPSSGPPAVSSPVVKTPAQLARAVAEKLGRKHFLIGMGNDLNEDHDKDGAYVLGPPLDIHYAYLVGLRGRDGWPDWNPDGSFVTILADTAKKHGVVPMFTLYSMAAEGEGRSDVLTNTEYMKAYWEGARLLFQRLGEFGDPAIVHLEPDFWAFMQGKEPDPKALKVLVEPHASECSGLGDTLAGMGHCLVRLARRYAPKTLVGFHASTWAHTDPKWTAYYLLDLGARDADLVVLETLDRDAGCFEAAVDPACKRTGGPWYWDETNKTSPNFHEHLRWARVIAETINRPLLWWQMPFGVPSDTPGGKPGQYRDNRVKYLFENVSEFVEAGGVGAVFGVGAGNQTYVTTDGGQFKKAVENYRNHPVLLGKP